MSDMLTRRFWVEAGERAVKTTAQSLGAILAASGAGVLDADWRQAASVAGMAGLLSLCTSLGSSRVGATRGPSMVDEGSREH